MSLPILSVKNLYKTFTIRRGFLQTNREECLAVSDVSFSLATGETLGLVGESGCGKSTLARMCACIEKPTAGEIYYKDENIFKYDKHELRNYRRKMQLIFQDPYASLNPRMNAEEIINEPFYIHEEWCKRKEKDDLDKLLIMVGLSPDQKKRYPHEFSGGQRQRIGIARAIALKPEIIIADEPVSALDVSVQAQILNLLKDLQEAFNLTYIFISHDMGVIRFMSDRVAVMYGGRIVEMGTNKQVFEYPQHPYTRLLLESVPAFKGRRGRTRRTSDIHVGRQGERKEGCPFYERCSTRLNICRNSLPIPKILPNQHIFACHLKKNNAA